MRPLPAVLAVIGVAIIGRQLLARGDGASRFAAMRRRMMERMMEAMPDDSPPKLITSILPRLKEQNDEVLALLREQNELLPNQGKKG